MSLSQIRREYPGSPLDEAHADPDPLKQFSVWFEQVRGLETDPTAMALATAARDGRPSVRTVLLKELDARGFVFYTNYESRKGREMDDTRQASLLFYWPSTSRQVRVEGSVERVSTTESDAYFATRPFESQLAAIVSPQSDPIVHREALDALFADAKSRHVPGSVTRPAFWGGYRVIPAEMEFWQGRENRLHDRLRYRRQGDAWVCDRLAP